MRKFAGAIWSIAKFLCRWLGPALMALAVWNFLFPPLPEILGNPAMLILQAGVLLTAIAAALLWRGSPAKKQHASILGIAAMLGFVVAAWQFWSDGQGYREEIVRFDSEGATLVGTLYLPETKGPHPGIVFVHGSGNMPRSANVPMGSSLARRGYVVLSYDKRGVGDSGGEYEWERNYCPDNLDLLARDAVAAMGVLRNRREVRADAVGLIGQSQGGWIVPRAAVKDPDTAFMLLLVGPTDTTHAIIKHERYRLGVTEGDKEMKVASAFALLGPGGPNIRDGMTPDQAFVEAQKTSPAFLCPSFDPLPDLRELTVPGLWVLGEQDWIVPVGTTTHKLETLRDEGKPYEYRKVPEVGHLLYGNSEPVDDAINSWLSRVTMQ